MTQSLLNQGKEGNSPSEYLYATPKWICAEDFKARPLNESEAPRLELVRKKTDGEQFLAIYNPTTGEFQDRCTCELYSPGALEVRIVEIK